MIAADFDELMWVSSERNVFASFAEKWISDFDPGSRTERLSAGLNTALDFEPGRIGWGAGGVETVPDERRTAAPSGAEKKVPRARYATKEPTSSSEHVTIAMFASILACLIMIHLV